MNLAFALYSLSMLYCKYQATLPKTLHSLQFWDFPFHFFGLLACFFVLLFIICLFIGVFLLFLGLFWFLITWFCRLGVTLCFWIFDWNCTYFFFELLFSLSLLSVRIFYLVWNFWISMRNVGAYLLWRTHFRNNHFFVT